MQQQIDDILEQIEQAFREKTFAPVLDRIMDFLKARAIGMWRCDNQGQLTQIGFRAVTEMDEHIRKQFTSFTKQVSLDNKGLGIVKAVVERKPAIGTLRGESGLQGSSEWLKKFGAQQSYAVPIFENDQVVGVLAISTTCVHQIGDFEWESLKKIAAGIGEKNFLGMF
ncbi:GAF domain-containing protein [Gimesia aquarii]|uniref:GAF domain-containing protein n=1 Tax=Gimesia aquarii TaxID=2527964 RepID=A0A517WV87_9PLAN|nr:GAF domain-containing protein [Gimesia aquarii]QDU09142.1 hypothetical protein V202x_25140 [Gimesia aquarii]